MEKKLTNGQFYGIFGGILIYGFILNAIFCIYLTPFFVKLHPIVLLISYLILVIIGCKLSETQGAFLSFIGYNLVVLPMGALISTCLVSYNMDTIFNAMSIVAIITLIMIIISVLFPGFVKSLGVPLFFSLIIVILVELIYFFIFIKRLQFIDHVVIIIFSGYIAYDFHEMSMKEKTVDAAVDGALKVYVDMINLFLRILRILDKKKK